MRPAMVVALVSVLLLAIAGVMARAEDPPPDWTPVGEVLGNPGKVLPDGTYRIDVPRKDPLLQNEFGFVVPPSMVLSYAAFVGSPGDATVIGDTCVLGEEVNPVIDILRAGGIEIVAVHNHMLGGTPNFIFVHFQARGNALELAATIRKAWDEMKKEHPLPARPKATAPKPDWKAVSEILGLPGSLTEDGMFKVVLPRSQLGTTLDGRPVTPGAGPACWVGFFPCECGLTMIMGDTCLLREELQKAIDGYRSRDIRIVATHNHMLGTKPELIFCHFAGEGDALDLARAVKAVWKDLEVSNKGK